MSDSQKPNDPCNCGSGRKFKKCHGGKAQKSFFTTPARRRPITTSIGMPGHRALIGLCRRSSDPTNPMNNNLPSGVHGQYNVVFKFAKPNHDPLVENHVSFDPTVIKGDSHLFLGKGNYADFSDDQCHIEYTGFANSSGYLDRVETSEFEAENFKDALAKAYDGVAPLLSRVSVMLDIPLRIFTSIVTEKSSGNMITDLIPSYISKGGLQLTDFDIPDVLSGLLGIYRDGVNSNTPYYQFLCFYRIIEGLNVVKIRKERKSKKINDSSIQNDQPTISEKIPSTGDEQVKWLNSLFIEQTWSNLALEQIFPKDSVGKEISYIEEKGGPLYDLRAKIAHTFVETQSHEIFSPDKSSTVAAVSDWLPLCKCLAVYELKKQYSDFFPKLNTI